MNDSESRSTPKYEQPPVVETVLSVQFKPLTKMRIIHFGQYHHIVSKYGFVGAEQYQPLEHQVEQKESQIKFFHFPSTVSPLPRVWFLSTVGPDGQKVIQLQFDRIVQNWRRPEILTCKYPSYVTVKASFIDSYKALIALVEQEKLGEIIPDQLEVAYVNQIPLKDFANVTEAFKECFQISIPAVSSPYLPLNAENLAFQCAYWYDSIQGRIFVDANSSSLIGTAGNTIDFRLTVRGAPEGMSLDHVLGWFDRAHDLIVNTFTDLTTAEMHKRWKRIK